MSTVSIQNRISVYTNDKYIIIPIDEYPPSTHSSSSDIRSSEHVCSEKNLERSYGILKVPNVSFNTLGPFMTPINILETTSV